MTQLPTNRRHKAVSPHFRFVSLDFELSVVNPVYVPQLVAIRGLNAHPLSWSRLRKSITLLAPFCASLMAAYAAGAYGMISENLQALWSLSTVSFNLGITIFVLGFGLGPVIFALISELYGRYWVFLGAGVVFFLGTVGCAMTQSFGGMLVSRLVTGSGGSVFAALTGGVVSDIFDAQDRNTPMALYSLFIMVGTGMGPMVSGALVDHLSWRWVFYLQMVLVGANTLAVLFLFQETRANVLLARNCRLLNTHLQVMESNNELPNDFFLPQSRHVCGNKPAVNNDSEAETADVGLRVRFQVSSPDTSSLWATIGTSFKFPLKLLATEPVVFWFSLWVAFAWAILYMQFSSIFFVYRNVYAFDNTEIGLVYIAVIVGSIAGCGMCWIQDRLLRRFRPRWMLRSESRLYFACIGSLFLPIGLFWFGWTAKATVHWVVPSIAIGMSQAGIFVIYLAVFNYLADAYGTYASSALTAQSLCRNLLAAVFPLFTVRMFENLGSQRVGSLLGGVGLGLCLVPWALLLYGETIRKGSAFICDQHRMAQ